MVSPESPPATGKPQEPTSGPRISFSSDVLDDADFICINPHDRDRDRDRDKAKAADFEFLSTNLSPPSTMLSADELFFEGKLLPFWQKQCSEKLAKISLKAEQVSEIATREELKVERNTNANTNTNASTNTMSWFIDEDPSPRPPKCTVLWKELLRLKKHRASTLSTSSSSSSSSSADDDDVSKKDKCVRKVKKGLERTRSAGIKLRPMVNLPVCSQGVRSNSLPPLYSARKAMLER